MENRVGPAQCCPALTAGSLERPQGSTQAGRSPIARKNRLSDH